MVDNDKDWTKRIKDDILQSIESDKKFIEFLRTFKDRPFLNKIFPLVKTANFPIIDQTAKMALETLNAGHTFEAHSLSTALTLMVATMASPSEWGAHMIHALVDKNTKRVAEMTAKAYLDSFKQFKALQDDVVDSREVQKAIEEYESIKSKKKNGVSIQ